MFKRIVLLVAVLPLFSMNSQELPYKEIPSYPETYSSGNIVARMVDGLGFRYYWATEGMTAEDLSYRASEDSRSVLETLQHIYVMSENILNAPQSKPNIRLQELNQYSLEELRKMTLENLQQASELYAKMDKDDFESAKVIFQRGENKAEFPFWNMLNGMLSDCIYHTGQIVLLRRLNGNPINPKVNVFSGKAN